MQSCFHSEIDAPESEVDAKLLSSKGLIRVQPSSPLLKIQSWIWAWWILSFDVIKLDTRDKASGTNWIIRA